MVLELAFPAWLAGAGLGILGGIAAPPIKSRLSGVNFLNKFAQQTQRRKEGIRP